MPQQSNSIFTIFLLRYVDDQVSLIFSKNRLCNYWEGEIEPEWILAKFLLNFLGNSRFKLCPEFIISICGLLKLHLIILEP